MKTTHESICWVKALIAQTVKNLWQILNQNHLLEVTYLYISGIVTIPKQSECNVNSYNIIYFGQLLMTANINNWLYTPSHEREVTYLYISGITTKPKQSECNVNSFNKDTIAICTCECPDLMKQLIFQGYVIFICTKCWLLVDFCFKI